MRAVLRPRPAVLEDKHPEAARLCAEAEQALDEAAKDGREIAHFIVTPAEYARLAEYRRALRERHLAAGERELADKLLGALQLGGLPLVVGFA